MSKDKDEMLTVDERTVRILETLRPVSPRDSEAAARGRAQFLERAKKMSADVTGVKGRHEDRKKPAFPVFLKDVRSPAWKTVVAVILAVAVFFGGGATTVYAAQDALPDETLYPVKTLSEDVRLSLTSSPKKQIDLTLDFADRRVNEMTGLYSNGSSIPESVVDRLQAELDLALQSASSITNDQTLVPALEQIRTRARMQLELANRLRENNPADPALTQACARLQEQVQLAAMGEVDPQGFREQIRERFQYRHGAATSSPAFGTGQQSTGAATSATPIKKGTPGGNGNGQGDGGYQVRNSVATPTPGSGTVDPTANIPATPEETLTPSGNGNSNGSGQGGSQKTVTSGQQGPGPQSPGGTSQPGGGGSGRGGK